MTYTHLIITRFMCDNFIKEDSNENIFSPEWKEMSFNMATRHIIPTLENQTNKNFKLIFLVANNLSNYDLERIKHLSNEIEIMPVHLFMFDSFIKNHNSDYLITSRLDYDDHVYNNCVEDIQNFLKKEEGIKAQIFGLNQGVSIVDGEYEAHLMYNYRWLHSEGCPAPMTTLILKRNICKEYFDIYKLGYHTEVVKNFLIVQKHYLLEEVAQYPNQIYTQKSGQDIDYIWIRHKHSASAICNNIIHTTNIKVDLSKQELKEKFGYIL